MSQNYGKDSDYHDNKSVSDIYRGDGAVYQQASATTLNSVFNRVYGWMCGALAITSLVAYAIAQRPDIVKMIVGKPLLFWGLMIGQILLVIGITGAINRISYAAAAMGFALYAALNGVIFSFIFLAYTGASIAVTFGVTALTFGATSLAGYMTKRDLSGVGGFFSMLLWGFIIGTVVNIFWANSTLYWLMTYLGIIIFAGLTAYDTQKIRNFAAQADQLDVNTVKKIALLGALTLYLDFINMFLLLLRLFGRGRD